MTNRLAMQSLSIRDPRIACGGNDAFALAIAVCLRSAIDALASDRCLGVYLIDAGISAKNRARIEASLPRNRIALEWLHADLDLLEDLPAIHGQLSRAYYSRLLLPRLLPRDLDRILYLDSDIVVCGDLGVLWDTPLAGHLALAVQEVAAPYFDCERALPHFERCEPFLAARRPIENYEDLGLDPFAPYFNSGVMLIDLEGWRIESIADQCFSVLEKNRAFVKFWDQYALNVVLTSRWEMLPERWNSSSHLMAIPDSSQCAFSAEAFEESRRRPEIIHFTGLLKPWQPDARRRLPRADHFHRVRMRTSWRGLPWIAVRVREFKNHPPKQIRKAIKRIFKPKGRLP
jgi:lipopolysaccharide biosynthesis glycosyltransferase